MVVERERERKRERHAELNGFELAHKFAYTSSVRRRMVGGVWNAGAGRGERITKAPEFGVQNK